MYCYTGETRHEYWLNQGDNSWAPASFVPATPSTRPQLSEHGVLLADMNGDARSDLLFTRGTKFGYWPSYGDGKWEEFVEYSRLPNFAFDDPHVRLVDVNGDGLTDVIRTDSQDYRYWLNLDGKAWGAPISRGFASIFRSEDGPGVVFSDDPESDARLADMNGDGLQDIVSVNNGSIRYWPHSGYLRFDRTVQMTDTPRLPSAQFHRERFLLGDINGDGFDDLLNVDVDRVYYWLNLHGTAWSQRRELTAAPFAGGNTDVRLADMDGNGTRDLIWSTPASPTDRTNYRYFDFVGAGNYPNLLTRINNNMGLVTEITYKAATEYYMDAFHAHKPWDMKLPIAVKVVASVRLIDNISHNELVTRYSYADGYYDGRDREFRGFAYAEEYADGDASSPTSLVKYYYHVGYAEHMGFIDAVRPVH